MTLVKLNFLMPIGTDLNTNSNALKWGKLILDNGINKISFMATSGLGGYQELQHSGIRRKGRLPSCKQAGIAHYSLDLSPIYLPNVKGVNGNFYRILPFEVNNKLGNRSDLGIHFDANVPGSSGCIVIKQLDHWQVFQNLIEHLAKTGIKSLPLYA